MLVIPFFNSICNSTCTSYKQVGFFCLVNEGWDLWKWRGKERHGQNQLKKKKKVVMLLCSKHFNHCLTPPLLTTHKHIRPRKIWNSCSASIVAILSCATCALIIANLRMKFPKAKRGRKLQNTMSCQKRSPLLMRDSKHTSDHLLATKTKQMLKAQIKATESKVQQSQEIQGLDL